MTATRPRRLGLTAAVTLLLSVAIAGVALGPQLAPALMSRNGALARAKRKFVALRAFALFRAGGDRAVLRMGDPPARAGRHVTPAH